VAEQGAPLGEAEVTAVDADGGTFVVPTEADAGAGRAEHLMIAGGKRSSGPGWGGPWGRGDAGRVPTTTRPTRHGPTGPDDPTEHRPRDYLAPTPGPV
jgi:hypothetical protein